MASSHCLQFQQWTSTFNSTWHTTNPAPSIQVQEVVLYQWNARPRAKNVGYRSHILATMVGMLTRIREAEMLIDDMAESWDAYPLQASSEAVFDMDFLRVLRLYAMYLQRMKAALSVCSGLVSPQESRVPDNSKDLE
jgi:hypothetical protein